MTSFAKYVGAACFAGLAVAAFAGRAVQQLMIDGNVVSSNVTQANGRYEVPVDDVAKYFGYTVSINGAQATLTKIPVPAPSNPGATVDSGILAGQTISSTSSTTATSSGQSMLSRQQPPTNISVVMGKSASVNGFDYVVASIQNAGSSYKDLYDQRGRLLHPRWKTDCLIVINFEVTNRGTAPAQAIIPGSAGITIFDGKRIGYQATALDQRQSSDVITAGSDDYSSYSESGTSNLVLGPGGTMHFAAIASVPKGDRVTSVIIQVPTGATDSSGQTGAIVTVER